MGNFISYELDHDLLEDLSNDEFPTQLLGFNEHQDDELILPKNGTHFGYVHAGELESSFRGND